MNKFLTLTKVLFKSTGESLIQKDKKKLPRTIGLLVLLAIGFIPMIISFVAMAAASYNGLATMGQEGLIISFGIVASCLIVFIFGIFYVMATFYFSSDIESLLPLPLKPSTILSAKFTVVLIYEYLTELLFMLPMCVTYGVLSSSGIVFYLYLIIVFLTLPIVPLVIASFISMIIMRFTPFAKNKDAFKTIAGILGLAIALGVNFAFQRLGSSMSNEKQMLELMTKGNNSLIQTTSSLFPTANLATTALVFNTTLNGLLNMLLYLVITIALLAVLLILGEALYFKGVIGISEAASKRKKLSSKELDESTVQSSALKSYTIKELKLLYRTPAYFMNCVLITFLLPIFLLIPLFSEKKLGLQLNAARTFLNQPVIPGVLIAIAFGVMIFVSVTNPTACTAISREGKNLFTCKYMPISYGKQIAAKLLSAIMLNLIGVGLLIIAAMVIFIPPVYLLLQLIVIAILVVLFSAFLGILIDLTYPKLDWDNEQRAVKQNMNVIITMLLGVVIAGLTIAAIIFTKLGLWQAFGAIVIVFGVLDCILYWLVSTYGVNKFKNI
ncbi:putative ABC transporter permease subunit [Candidatus Clostridium radicumherbarum]|uniref:ABC transporter permease subunit n=1 Tax=Candidatus Clostridium radicumherbarum TaxID=3381662 RepID=A0ABW8TU94_9CLOT